METLYRIFLIIHIAAGSIALGCGLVALISRKGRKTHRGSGKIYFICMAVMAATALAISAYKSNFFLLSIAIFTFFMTYSGYRSIKNKSLKPNVLDMLVLTVGFANSLWMIFSLNIVLMVFGGIGCFLSIQDIHTFIRVARNKKIPADQWLVRHIGMMIGSYIAASTAFVVVNVHNASLPWLPWLMPTFIGVPIISYWIYRTKKYGMKGAVAVALLLATFSAAKAQPYVTGGNTRHRFAQMTVGTDFRVFPGAGSQSFQKNSIGLGVNSFTLSNHQEARLIIGGTHFWGHADFYVAFPVAYIGKSNFATTIETGAKYYPWRIRHKKLRLYIGAAFLPTRYQQGAGASQIRSKYPVLAGLTYTYKKHLLEAGMGYFYNNSFDYYITPTEKVRVKSQPMWFSIGYKFMFETTVSAEKDWQSGRTKLLTDTLAKLKKLNGLTLAAGPSTAFFLEKSAHNKAVAPAIDNHKVSGVFADLGIGYYFHNPDIQFNLAYRRYKSTISAYGFEQTARRTSLALEGYKFLFDYHGFVLFIGPSISQEWLEVDETGQSANYEGIKPGITFGWDIRPNRLQGIVLRTNLRYFPGLAVTMSDGKKVPFSGLEFNFIQIVIYPKRIF